MKVFLRRLGIWIEKKINPSTSVSRAWSQTGENSDSWFKMLRGGNVVRRSRQGRVLSKTFQRSTSITVADNPPPQPLKLPSYAEFIFFSFVFAFLGLNKHGLVFLFLVLLRYGGPFILLKTTSYAYSNRRPHHGPTYREKCLYYMD